MKSLPALCTDTRISESLREAFTSIWQSMPWSETRKVVLPRAEWTGELRDACRCIVVTNRDSPAFITHEGLSEFHLDMFDIDPGAMRRAGRTMYATHVIGKENLELASTPTPGQRVYISADAGDSAWMVEVMLYIEELLNESPVQSVAKFEELGMTFTDNFVEGATYWLSGTVQAVKANGIILTILTEVDDVIWNESLDTGMSEALAAANRNARAVTRVAPPNAQASDEASSELERNLTDPDWGIRRTAIWDEKNILNAFQIERAQRDKKSGVRREIANRKDLPLDAAHVEIGLTDQRNEVREIYAYRTDYTLTTEQIERGLTEACDSVIFTIARRRDLTPEQIERGISHPNMNVRSKFVEVISERKARMERIAGIESKARIEKVDKN